MPVAPPTPRRVVPLVAGACIALGSIGAVALVSLHGAARADHPLRARPDGPSTFVLSPFTTIDTGGPFITGPILTLVPPIFTLPPFATALTLPPFATAETVTGPSTDPSTTLATTDPATTDPSSTDPAATDTDGTTTTPGATSAEAVAPRLEVLSARVGCDGVLRIEFETAAVPAPAPTADHIIVVNPVLNPTSFAVQEIVDQVPNGQFSVDLQATVPEAYRVFVIANFDSDNPDGVALVDQGDAAVDIGCPVPTTTTG